MISLFQVKPRHEKPFFYSLALLIKLFNFLPIRNWKNTVYVLSYTKSFKFKSLNIHLFHKYSVSNIIIYLKQPNFFEGATHFFYSGTIIKWFFLKLPCVFSVTCTIIIPHHLLKTNSNLYMYKNKGIDSKWEKSYAQHLFAVLL